MVHYWRIYRHPTYVARLPRATVRALARRWVIDEPERGEGELAY